MTTAEKLNYERRTSYAITEKKGKGAIRADTGIFAQTGTGVTFSDALYSITADAPDVFTTPVEKAMKSRFDTCETADGAIVDVPERWLGGYSEPARCFASGIKAAENFLKNKLGIDPDKREPTHEITDEQREWLESRHELSKINGDGEEYGELVADLIYLNVYTPMEIASMHNLVPTGLFENGSQIARVGAGFSLFDFQPDIFGLLDKTKEAGEDKLAEAIMEYLKKRYSYAKPEDEESAKAVDSAMAKENDCLFALLSLFVKSREEAERVDEQRYRDNLNFKDASRQFDEDFGALINI